MKFSSFLWATLVFGHLLVLSTTVGYFIGYEHGFSDGYSFVLETIKPILNMKDGEAKAVASPAPETNPVIETDQKSSSSSQDGSGS
jgi:hypothetical protein